MDSSDVVIVGGGAVGCAAAFFLARAGLSVTLFERDDLAAHASGAAAGMLAPLCESTGEGAFFRLGMRSLEMFPALVEDLRELGGVDPQYVPSGVLQVALSEAEAGHLRGQAARLAAWGLEWLSGAAAREREPHLAPEVLGALWSPREGHVYSPALARAYALAAAGLGARIRIGVAVTGLERSGDRVHGVRTTAGPHGAAHVILAAGVWTRFCAEWLGTPLPVEPIRGQIVGVDMPAPPFRAIVWGEEAYLVPKLNGSVVIGATEERAGFDCRTTTAGVARLLGAAPRLVPALADCAFQRAWAGLRPDTPDHLPVLGPIPGIEGVVLAAGHYRNGVLLSPVTGELLTGWITRGELPEDARPFTPARFLESARQE